MEITEEQIEDAAVNYAEDTIAVGDKDFLLEVGFAEGAKWMQDQIKPDWVPVAERLPEIGQYVQAAIKGGVLLYSCVLEKNNTWYGYGYAQPETRITHWMPLPDPPKAV